MRPLSKAEPVALAVLAYVPFLASLPGRVSADSKQYLYLDPGAFLARTLDLWDPQIGAGTVPHQHLGYAFPIGPWFWAFERLGAPVWLAQRLWLGTLTFLALLGARWLFAQLGTGRPGALAGAVVYGLTPYQLAFTGRTSVLLLPWAALPWLVGLTIRATRTRTWRAPATLGLVLVLVGGTSAASLLLVALAPLLWVVMEAANGRQRAAAALAGAGRAGVLAIGVSLWWLVGLRLQGAHGLPVLQLTENLRTVAERSSPGDVLRGLGNWVFYARDPTGYSVSQAADYDGRPLVVALSYAVPAVALLAGLLVRWAHRAYFGLLVVVGAVVAVGSYPYDDPSPYGSVWKAFAHETSLGLAFRNSPRAVPLLVLGLAGLLAALVGALPRFRIERLGAVAVVGLALAALLPVWETGWLPAGYDRPEEIPAYWREAGAAIDAGDHGTRVLEVPGASFAAYTWGTLVDPITPGLTDRPYLAREILPYGTPPSVNLIDALDRRMQLGTFEASSLAPVARLLGASTVSLRADLERSARFDPPPPGPLWRALTGPEAGGLGPPKSFGPLAGAGPDPEMPAVALFEIEDPEAIVRTRAAAEPVVLSGDGDGIVDAAASGLLDGRSLVLQSAALDDTGLRRALANGAHLVLTDSNRRRIQTWFYTLRNSKGPTERAGRTAPDPTGYDFRLDPFPGSSDGARTVVEQVGGRVEVTSEGGPERPEDRGAHAVDGDPSTSWRVGGADAVGQAITLVTEEPVRVDRVRLVQPPSARAGRALARVRIVINDGEPIEVELGPASLEPSGQVIAFPEQAVEVLRIEVVSTTTGPGVDPLTPAGLAEIGLGSTRVAEVVRLPMDLLERVGTSLDGHGLDIVLTRLRLDLPGTDRQDDEPLLDRRFELPLARSFALTGTARLPVSAAPETSNGAERPCRDDLVRIDDRPVAVRVTGLPVPGGSGVAVTGCGPIDLSAGSHRLTAQASAAIGWAVDRIVLSTDTAGEPAGIAPRGAQGNSAPPVRILESGASALDVQIDAGTQPFWLVLGQSASEGWSAAAKGARVGPRTLVDGYANGWLITPDGAGPIGIDLRWGPQRVLRLGIAASALAVSACGLILVRGRRRPGEGPLPTTARRPRLAVPFSRPAWQPVPATAAAAGTLVALGTALVASPGVAAIAFVATVAAALAPYGRILLVALGPTALVLSRLTARPSLAWLALAVLAADLLLGRHDLKARPQPG